MLGETQEQFVGRVREALAVRGVPVALPDDLEVSRVMRGGPDLIERFLRSVEQAKMNAHRVPDETGLVQRVLEIARELAVRRALVTQEECVGRDALCAALRAEGVELLAPDERENAFTADVGITWVELAIAETGSMVLASGGPRRRLASLAVPVHIGVVRAEQIVPDLLDWTAYMDDSGSVDSPASTVLVSGPSKTADIELTLVMGVHGPRVEHVIVVG